MARPDASGDRGRGQHEFRNWICLAGAMTELGADVEIVDYMESYVLNSNKCFAIMRP